MAGFFDRIRTLWQNETKWPPPQVKEHWADVAGYRRRYENTKRRLIEHNPNIMLDTHAANTYVPVPWARELCRFSASLLFSETPKVTYKGSEEPFADLFRVNDFGAFAVRGGVKVAAEGRAAVRIIRDPEVNPDIPLLALVNEDQVIWDIRHGHFYRGGMVVVERYNEEEDKSIVYRLLEEHTPGQVARYLYRGHRADLGKRVALSKLREFEGLADEESTGLNSATLVPWENIPGAESDLFGLGPMLDTINEAETLMLDRARKAIPRLFVDRSLMDDAGRALIDGMIPTGGARMRAPLGSGTNDLIAMLTPKFLSKTHIGWIDHLNQLMVTCAGYSPETWGIQGHTANVQRAVSGYAMKLAQLRTLLTRAAKEHMALQALGWSIATAMAWQDHKNEVSDYLPSIELGDGLPSDPLDGAQEVLYLQQAQAASTQTLVKTVHPTWSEEEVDAEVARIQDAAALVGMGQGIGPINPAIRELLRASRGRNGKTTTQDAGGGTDPTEGVLGDDE